MSRRISLHYLFAVCHSSDNITQVLDIDDSEETEDYTVDYLQGSSPFVNVNFAQHATNSDNLCDICWSAETAKVVFVPCGHFRLKILSGMH